MESVFEGVDSLKIMLEDAEFAETRAQDRCDHTVFETSSATEKYVGRCRRWWVWEVKARLRTT